MLMVGHLIFKIVIAGDGGVGKTTIRKRFVLGTYTERYNMTIGSAFSVKDFAVTLEGQEGTQECVKLSIIDLGGQPQFKTLRKLFYKGIAGAMLVFDLTNKRSMLNLEEWIKEIIDSVGKVPIIIVGNKEDLIKMRAERTISKEEINIFLENIRNTFDMEFPYFETSAKTGEGIYDALAELTKMIICRLGTRQQAKTQQIKISK